jgi:hypothetical protein
MLAFVMLLFSLTETGADKWGAHGDRTDQLTILAAFN